MGTVLNDLYKPRNLAAQDRSSEVSKETKDFGACQP